jgi:hypothetical protein
MSGEEADRWDSLRPSKTPHHLKLCLILTTLSSFALLDIISPFATFLQAIFTRFASRADFETYRDHPQHIEFVTTVIRPNNSEPPMAYDWEV